MALKYKKTIVGERGGKVTQLSRSERNINKKKKVVEDSGKPRLVLNEEEYLQVIDKLNILISKAHPDWNRKRVLEEIDKTLKRK